MNVNAVEVNSSVSGGAVATVGSKPHLEGSRAQQATNTDFEAGRENVKQMVEKMQEQIDSMNVSLRYSTYGNHGERTAVAIVNKETGELIREIPAKELQRLYSKMSELAGMIFNREI